MEASSSPSDIASAIDVAISWPPAGNPYQEIRAINDSLSSFRCEQASRYSRSTTSG
ncbi:hypothetical protein ACLOJK_031010 [Asimina triloba]